MVDLTIEDGFGYQIAAVVYGFATILLAASWRGRTSGAVLILAMAATALWAGLEAVSRSWLPLQPAVIWLAEVGRTGAWIMLMTTLLKALTRDREARAGTDPLLAAAVLLLCLAMLQVLLPLGLALPEGMLADPSLTFLLLTVLGLTLIENLFSAARGDARWAFKHLVIGLAALFLFDLFFYSNHLLFRQSDQTLVAARPLVDVLAVPLLLVAAARIRGMTFEVAISRQAVLHTGTLIGTGAYLLVVAGVGYLLRETGLALGALLWVLFLAAALIALAVLLVSGSLRAWLKTLIAVNFFTFIYDYRHEWLRFIRTMTDYASPENLYERAVRAMADVLECTGGILFLRNRDEAFVVAGRSKWPGATSLLTLPAPLAERLVQEARVLDFRKETLDAAGTEALARLGPAGDPWLLVPLRSRDRILGAVLLGRPRVVRPLTWEDHDILSILGIQIGGYLAEEQLVRALVEAQRFEQLSKNFSFIAHDLKNLISQLSLIVQQAGRHGDNPEFQRDALATVGESVEKMRAMLTRLSAAEPEPAAGTILDLQEIVCEVAERRRRFLAGLTILRNDVRLPVRIERTSLLVVLENIFQNALDAIPDHCRMTIRFRLDDGAAIAELADNGPGMSQDFIETALFRPFVSTKGGFGIGLYQSRDILIRWGGRLEAASAPGQGTTIRIRLPRQPTPTTAPSANAGAANAGGPAGP